MWVNLNSPFADWLEFGTGHQCNDTYRYWFWGYGEQGIWYPMGPNSSIPSNSTNTWQIEYSGGSWYWATNGLVVNSIYWPVRAEVLETGLESYSAPAFVDWYNHSSLKYRYGTGGWTASVGQDAFVVDAGKMSGAWVSASNWKARESGIC
jgi:hypothetical protein